MTQRRELSPGDLDRVAAARAKAEESRAEYQRLVLELGDSIGVRAVCRAAGISVSVYRDWKSKAAK